MHKTRRYGILNSKFITHLSRRSVTHYVLCLDRNSVFAFSFIVLSQGPCQGLRIYYYYCLLLNSNLLFLLVVALIHYTKFLPVSKRQISIVTFGQGHEANCASPLNQKLAVVVTLLRNC